MINISVEMYLRPTRFAFLVRPDDAIRILEIFQINNCLWGGKFNPIIPYFEKSPSRPEKRSYKSENVKQIINGYLNLFEPDFIVEAEEGLSKGYDFHPYPIIQLNDFFKIEGGRPTQQIIKSSEGFYGMSPLANKEVIELLNELSKKRLSILKNFRIKSKKPLITIKHQEGTLNYS